MILYSAHSNHNLYVIFSIPI